ncbi:hypothetical protein APSETT444_009678 [Aspergillus pseudonomiae]
MEHLKNPKDSMRSTWRRWDRSQWTLSHKLFEHANLYHVDLDRKVPVHSKEEKIPYVSDWSLHRWIIFHASIPLIVHQLFVYLTGQNFGPIVAFGFYYYSNRIFTSRELRGLRELGHTYGFLDGDKHERDGIPDVGVSKVLTSVMLASLVRPMMIVYLTYSANETPTSMNWRWLPLEVNSEQEFFDIAGIPLMTYVTMKFMGFPMGFYEWHICQLYVLFAELAGHSGLRLHASPPNPLTWLMRMFDAELVIEDHDLHHRKGWRKSHNYGKQTRVWDRVFGTCCDRIEGVDANIDYTNTVEMSIF